MEYKITLRNHFRALEGILFLGVFLIVVVIVFKKYTDAYYLGIERDFLIFWLINLLPVMYLHLEYYLYNRKSRLEIDSNKGKLTYIDKTTDPQTYNFEDIDKIIVYMAPHWHSKKMFIRVPFDQYHYARILTHGGKELIITNLMVSKVQDAVYMRGVTIELKKRIFASILLDNFHTRVVS